MGKRIWAVPVHRSTNDVDAGRKTCDSGANVSDFPTWSDLPGKIGPEGIADETTNTFRENRRHGRNESL